MAEQQTRDGSRLYRSILARDPSIKRKHYGETIWIDTQTGQYEIGEGVPAVDRLIERVGVVDGRNFFSRRIGELTRI